MPLRVMALMLPPVKPPLRTSKSATTSFISSHGVHADRWRLGLATRGTRVRQAEQVVVHRSIDLNVVEAGAATGDADGIGVLVLGRRNHKRIQTRKIIEAPVDVGQVLDLTRPRRYWSYPFAKA